jgi:hypothetical protein
MAEAAMRDDHFGLDGKVAIVTGGGAVNDGIGNGRAAAILRVPAPGCWSSISITSGPSAPWR